MPSFRVLRAGRLSYEAGLALQERLVEERLRNNEECLVLLEHDPVITLGRGARESHLLLSPAELARRGIACHRVSRGGDVTWHGPGQLVGYPIIHLDLLARDLHRYLRLLEDSLIMTLAAFGVCGERLQGKTGVWVKGRKMASIGVGVRRWVSWHGFALNIAPDLSGFDTIVPCGLSDVTMTSLAAECGGAPALSDVEEAITRAFASTFNLHFSGNDEISLKTETGLA